MAEPTNSDDVEHIDHIQQRTDEIIRYSAIGVGMIGGPEAVDDHLHHTLDGLVGVAIHELGYERACALLAHGYITAENYVE